MTPQEALVVVGASRRESSGIYMIHCSANDKCYIGQSGYIATRIKAHRSALRRGSHNNCHLQAAWTKYGEAEFSFVVLTNCPKEDLNAQEEHWVCKVDRERLFNLGDVGDGFPRTPEHRRRISEAKKGRPFSEEHRRALSEARKGRPAAPEKMTALRAGLAEHFASGEHRQIYTPEVRAKMSAARKGYGPTEAQRAALRAYSVKPKSEETKRKISEAQKGKPRNPESIAKMVVTKRSKPQGAWNKGRPLSEAHKQALRSARRRNKKKEGIGTS